MTHHNGAPVARAACPPPVKPANPTPHPVAEGIRARVLAGIALLTACLVAGGGHRERVLPGGVGMRVAGPQKPGS